MEKAILDFFFSAFIVFHQSIGLVVILLLILCFMSGRRPNPLTYTGIFVKTLLMIAKKSLKTCEELAKGTAAMLPSKYAKWRPLVRIAAQPIYCVAIVSTIVLLINKCAQP
jgi:hypothetical protein